MIWFLRGLVFLLVLGETLGFGVSELQEALTENSEGGDSRTGS